MENHTYNSVLLRGRVLTHDDRKKTYGEGDKQFTQHFVVVVTGEGNNTNYIGCNVNTNTSTCPFKDKKEYTLEGYIRSYKTDSKVGQNIVLTKWKEYERPSNNEPRELVSGSTHL